MAMIPMDALQTGLSGKRRNWVYFFFVLAAFNLLTVSFSLILNHQLLNIQHQTVEGNLAWVDQLKLCDVLAEKAAEVNNPANRLLHSHLVAAEAARSAAAMAHFNQVFSELARQRPVQQPYFQSTYFKTDLTNIQKEFAELGANTEAIFEQARKNQWQEVADCLAGLSVDYNDVLRALDTLRAHIRADRDLFLRMELKKARELAGREWFLGGLILLMVLGTVGYGVKLLRQMAAFEMDRRRAEQQLLIRAKAMEAAANAIVITDREGKIIWVNPSFTRLTGYPADEAIGRNPRLLKSGKQNTAFFTNLWETITSDKVWEGELTNRRKDGTFYAQHMTITPIHGLKNTDTCYIAIMEDITVRKQAELKAMLLEASAEAALDGIMAVDNEGHTLLVNRQFGEMWKIPQSLLDAKDDQQLLAYVLTQLKQPEEFIQKVAYLYQHKDEQSRDEIEFLDGQRFDRYSAPLRSADDQIQGRLWYFRNITARRSAGTEKS